MMKNIAMPLKSFVLMLFFCLGALAVAYIQFTKETSVASWEQFEGSFAPLSSERPETSGSAAGQGPAQRRGIGEGGTRAVNISGHDQQAPVKHHFVGFVVDGGCSGSSAVWRISKELLEAHGFNIFKMPSESLKVGKNKFFSRDKGPYSMIMKTHTRAKKRNMIWISKIDLSDLKKPEKLKALKELNVPVFISYRQDHMANMICKIRDCFPLAVEEGYGYPVYPNNGSKWDLCFDRRKMFLSTGQTSMVYMDVDYATQEVKNAGSITTKKVQEMQQVVLRSLGQNAAAISSEDLGASQASADMLPTSFEASKQVLRSFGVEPQDDLIMQVLEKSVGTRRLESNREKVYNYNAIKEASGKDF